MDHQQPEADNLTPADVAAMRQFIMGFRLTQLIYIACKLHLADHLEAGPRTPADLAQAVGAESLALHRLLRALATVEIFAEDDGKYQLTPRARLLQSHHPHSLQNVALLYGDEWLWQAYGRMLWSVQTGRPAFDEVHGQTLFDYLDNQPLAAAAFQNAMTAFSTHEADAILAAYDFSHIGHVVDIGGGQGALLAAVLEANVHCTGTLFDVPSVIVEAQRFIAKRGLTERCICVAGDFFVGVPAGGDLYLFKSVVHNWNDTASIQILRQCRAVMHPDARIVLAERVIPPGNAPSEAKLFDINMLVVLGGQERTEQEYRTLFEQAGLRLTRVMSTDSALSLVEGVIS